ncbi:MAG: glycoside hydrolase family 38 C-terminal domain-containing protein [Desulfobacterales bacterium]
MANSRPKDASPAPEAHLNIHLFSHTHWDFEWYEIEEGFKLQLVCFIDHLLNTLEKDPQFTFHFDGQVMPIIDYLEVLEERDGLDDQERVKEAEEKIRKFIQRGQLFIGPSWTTMETSIISTESLIRNINRGRRFSKKLGGVSTVFYNADAFQYHSQVPQIIEGTALTSAFTWRAYKKNEPLKDVSIWEGADKTAIIKYHPVRTYAQIWHLPLNAESAADIILHEARQSGYFAVCNHVLITQGNDQFQAQPELTRIIHEVKDILDNGFSIDQMTLEDFFSLFKDRRLNVIRGELTGNKWACTMSGQLSARMYLKQKNEKAEIFMEKWAEPFATFDWLLGSEYQAGLIERAWVYLMKQHFHHCNACAVDAVHREGEVRYNSAIELARDLTDTSIRHIAARVDTSKLIHKWENALVVFNPVSAPINDIITVNISPRKLMEDADWQTGYPSLSKEAGVLSNLIVWDEDEHVVPIQMLSKEKGLYEVALQVKDVPPFGYKTFGLDFNGIPAEPDDVFIADEKEGVLENEWIKIRVRKNGSFTLIDKRNNEVYEDVNLMEDTGDHGDTYNYDPLENDRPITTHGLKGKVFVSANGPLSGTITVKLVWPLPESLTSDRKSRSGKTVNMPVKMEICLTKNSAFVEIRTTIENRVRDHRLRVLFPGVKSDYAYVQTQADVVKRKLHRPLKYKQSRERRITHHTSVGELPMETGPSPTQFQRNFVGMNDGTKGLVVFNKGLPEYEASPDGTVALTLLRCVGWISQDDLGTRIGLAGPRIAVPDAQCPGLQVFEYAVWPQAGPWETGPVFNRRNRYSAGVKAVQVPWQEKRLPSRLSFLEIYPDELMVSSIKKAYKDGFIMVRFYNPTGKKLSGGLKMISGIQEAWIANMNEKKLERISVGGDGGLHFEVSAKKIMTLAVLPKPL